MSDERCFLIGIAPGNAEKFAKRIYSMEIFAKRKLRFEVTAVDCSAMEECRNDDEHFVVLQSMVDGYIEHVTEPEELKGRCLCFVNEEGVLRELTGNIGASLLLGRTIVGMLCICKGDSPDTFFTKDEAVKLGREITEIIKKRYDNVIEKYRNERKGELKV